MTLPSAPPSTSARPRGEQRVGAAGQPAQPQPIAMLTLTASAMNNQRCQPEAEARKLNAAPTLCMRVMSSTGSTRRELELAVMPRNVDLAELVGEHDQRRQQQPAPAVPRSSCLVRSLRSCEMALLAGTFDVDDAARAKFRMPRIAADVAAQMPAAHALRLLRWVCTSIHTSSSLVRTASAGGVSRLRDARLARDQQKAQLVAAAPRSAQPAPRARRWSTSASSGAPISPAERSRSSSRATSVLSAMNAGQSISEPRSAPTGNWCQVLKNTDSLRHQPRQKAPDLVGRETQNRRDPAHHGLRDVIHRRLRRAARRARRHPWCRADP